MHALLACRKTLLAATVLGAAGAAATAAAVVQVAPHGDAARGRVLLLQRHDTGCVLCHAVPGLPQGGALGPPLAGLARRYDADSLRLRIADARRTNPETVMPPYGSTEGLVNVARAYAGRSVLTAQALADIVAYLLQAGDAATAADAPR